MNMNGQFQLNIFYDDGETGLFSHLSIQPYVGMRVVVDNRVYRIYELAVDLEKDPTGKSFVCRGNKLAKARPGCDAGI